MPALLLLSPLGRWAAILAAVLGVLALAYCRGEDAAETKITARQAQQVQEAVHAGDAAAAAAGGDDVGDRLRRGAW